VKRIPALLVAVVAVVGTGALASACDVTPDAASVNSDTISVAALNTRLDAIEQSSVGACYLAVRNGLDLTTSAVGAGGPGTYQTAFAGTILGNQVGFLLTAQYAASLGIHLTATDVSDAGQEFASELDAQITTLDQQAIAGGTLSPCQKADGTAYSGQELLAAVPAVVRNDEVANLAVEDRLLAHGADLSDAAVLNYYVANQSEFTQSCVSVIATGTQAEAEAVVAKLRAGASFSQLASTTSIDTQTATDGGQLGCNFTESEVLQSLGQTSVTVGQPTAPVAVANGNWEVFEVTSQTVVPVEQAATLVRQYLTHTTANSTRVSTELLAFAHRSSISVNPQYGTWSGLRIVAPTSPPVRYLPPGYVAAGAGVTPSSTAGAGATTSPATGEG
jgi:hypothetical protein